MGRSSLARWSVVVGIAVALWCIVAVPARATYGARTAADEPQYLLSALSLWEDRDLDIADELRAERWRAFHEGALPEQTRPLDGGQRLSPHDPLLPVLLAAPMGLGGWPAAKVTLAGIAGLLAGLLVWVAVRRFDVPAGVATATVLSAGLAAPLAPYGVQVYPELPAALVVTVAVAGLTGPWGRGGRIAWLLAVVALPWLAVKYAPVAAVLAALGLLRSRHDRRRALADLAALGLAAGAFLVAHRAIYGGWTVYAAGDHFVGGEFTVAGRDPDLLGRSRRLAGLVIDREFGLAAWAPAYLIVPLAVGAAVRRRPAGWAVLVLPLAAGWLTATFVALTMHGWWWPGRQVVVVVPLAVLAVAWWLGHVAGPLARRAAAALAAFGVVAWVWILAEVLAGHRRLIIDFASTGNPLVPVWQWFLPDGADPGPGDNVRHVLWCLALLGLAVAGWRGAAPLRHPNPQEEPHHVPLSRAAESRRAPRDPVVAGRMR